MVWNIELRGDVLLWVEVREDFLEWLRRHVRDPAVAAMDPYGDTVLDQAMQERWRDELGRVASDLKAEARARVTASQRLPQDREAAGRVLDQLADRELRRTPFWERLTELKSAIELSIETRSTIRAIGD